MDVGFKAVHGTRSRVVEHGTTNRFLAFDEVTKESITCYQLFPNHAQNNATIGETSHNKF